MIHNKIDSMYPLKEYHLEMIKINLQKRTDQMKILLEVKLQEQEKFIVDQEF